MKGFAAIKVIALQCEPFSSCLCVSHTHAHTCSLFLSWWQWEGRAKRGAVEKVIETAKNKSIPKDDDTTHTSLSASFLLTVSQNFHFFQDWFFCLVCVQDIAAWLQGHLFGLLKNYWINQWINQSLFVWHSSCRELSKVQILGKIKYCPGWEMMTTSTRTVGGRCTDV